jgi:hypothetical protein
MHGASRKYFMDYVNRIIATAPNKQLATICIICQRKFEMSIFLKLGLLYIVFVQRYIAQLYIRRITAGRTDSVHSCRAIVVSLGQAVRFNSPCGGVIFWCECILNHNFKALPPDAPRYSNSRVNCRWSLTLEFYRHVAEQWMILSEWQQTTFN